MAMTTAGELSVSVVVNGEARQATVSPCRLLRVCPETLDWITKFSQHEAD
jgi:hypothetical protein